ncbi:MAG: hypothetical protein M1441_01665 [Candidatus Parvarchaeota archaeon]|nr:hypothetical protein [Candidatus Parvarchaeota archaeon]
MEVSEKLSELEKALKLSWSADTSADPDGWRNRNPNGSPYEIVQNKLQSVYENAKKIQNAIDSDLGYAEFVANQFFYKFAELFIDSPENLVNSNLAWGQGAVTALVVQDYFVGVKLVQIPVLNIEGMSSHYYNELDEKEVDLSKSQFDGLDVKFGKKTYIEGGYLLSPKFPQITKGYKLLRKRVADSLYKASLYKE